MLAGGEQQQIERGGITPRAQMRRQREIGGLGRAAGENQVAGRRPQARRDFSRAASSSPRAARPSAWIEEGLPSLSSAASIASRARGRKGAVAL